MNLCQKIKWKRCTNNRSIVFSPSLIIVCTRFMKENESWKDGFLLQITGECERVVVKKGQSLNREEGTIQFSTSFVRGDNSEKRLQQKAGKSQDFLASENEQGENCTLFYSTQSSSLMLNQYVENPDLDSIIAHLLRFHKKCIVVSCKKSGLSRIYC